MRTDFIDLALRTKADTFFPAPAVIQDMAVLLVTIAIAAEELDRCKKSLFYGKPYETADFGDLVVFLKDHVLTDGGVIPTEYEGDVDLLHGVVGLATELGELITPLVNEWMKDEEIDRVNLVEEIGDLLWYQALVLKVLGSDFATASDKVVNKLRIRYPEKFTEDQALNRNLEEERAVLEA
ncbi:MazG nucleotide pyrophosphohydrolase domain-containing protein [Inquilinus limosus]|uniref:MazG nucleotide pyrophosphohydrolase domain-containing protein n=1 Tax=Inquilinus limosus TaxID=171674 RepID=UPI00068C5E73|nr:MazG nucleotide pyrophosphohydrolase domain-containing protein [Inquilinus limosus]